MTWVILIVAALFVAWATYKYRGRANVRGPGAEEGRHGNRGSYWAGGGGS